MGIVNIWFVKCVLCKHSIFPPSAVIMSKRGSYKIKNHILFLYCSIYQVLLHIGKSTNYWVHRKERDSSIKKGGKILKIFFSRSRCLIRFGKLNKHFLEKFSTKPFCSIFILRTFRQFFPCLRSERNWILRWQTRNLIWRF